LMEQVQRGGREGAGWRVRDSAVQVHEARVLLALPVILPGVAVLMEVGALWRAEAAGGGAMLVHVVGRALALACLGPRGARLLHISADEVADSASVRTQLLDVLGVLALALALAAPRPA